MPKSEDRFHVRIKLEQFKLDEEGNKRPYASTEQVYEAMGYDDMIRVQGATAQSLVNLGIEAAQEMEGNPKRN